MATISSVLTVLQTSFDECHHGHCHHSRSPRKRIASSLLGSAQTYRDPQYDCVVVFPITNWFIDRRRWANRKKRQTAFALDRLRSLRKAGLSFLGDHTALNAMISWQIGRYISRGLRSLVTDSGVTQRP
jgi:hypothetical protein